MWSVLDLIFSIHEYVRNNMALNFFPYCMHTVLYNCGIVAYQILYCLGPFCKPVSPPCINFVAPQWRQLGRQLRVLSTFKNFSHSEINPQLHVKVTG